MILRRANKTDAASIAELYNIVWSKEINLLGEKLAAERQPDESIVREWLERDVYFAVEIERSLIAVIGCEERHGTLHLVHLVTHSDHRRSGYARALMEKAEAYAREIGVNKLWFDTSPGLDAARVLYKSLGYKKCGQLKRHYWGTDIVLYEKLL